ncbi:unnamed protein product [Blepharisma stoltei]|uniref:dual-specificity kinase n=1 Tax=Blepharisma stoltei TaxID=1481888 RepID=A0AAU9IXY3_9CILI|nr:unnamed protein product [Blepharisma stoltei]
MLLIFVISTKNQNMSFDSYPTSRTQRLIAAYGINQNITFQSSSKRVPFNTRQKIYMDLSKNQLSPKRNFKQVSNRKPPLAQIPELPIKDLTNQSMNLSSSSKRVFESLLSHRASKPINISFNTPTNSSGTLKKNGFSTQRAFKISMQDINFPISAHECLKLLSQFLTDQERAEILEYQEIYYVGDEVSKLKNFNKKYDDEKGNYKISIGDHIAYRYEIIERLGKGSFGQVIKCIDHKSGEIIALKIIKNKKRFKAQGLVEVKVLNLLNIHDKEDNANIVRMKDSFSFRSHLCLTFELLSLNLYEFLKLNSLEGLSSSLVRRFAIQILESLKYIKSLSVIHCDLKPENILLKSPTQSAIKLIDFGSSCLANERIYTYIQSRFYRAPEIMLGIPYTHGIDMWSFGCIIAELYTGHPLFPGESEHEQMARIMEVLGLPPQNLLELSSRKGIFFDEEGDPYIVPNSKGKVRYPGATPLQSRIGLHDNGFLEFLERSLQWDPEVRMTPEEALNHPWILQSNKNGLANKSRPVSNRRKGRSFLSEDFTSSTFRMNVSNC